ncbi:glucose 1-dehydrogenase [Dactylosporangium sp. NPDC005572]|uniref:SDR family NAD(P)-dependent oxidoreductase n=1 Tax=Dactylosporangium sp. NPDC005572 TaxID=3156889 RepID=UPI0033B0B13E
MSGWSVDLSGRTAIVTGGGSGIGRATCLALAHCGADVVIAGRREDALRETAELLTTQTGSRAHVTVTDVRDHTAVERMVQYAIDQSGRIDVLVNNAGGTILRLMEDQPMESWNNMITLNLTSAYSATRAAAPHLEKVGGAIVNVSSSAATTGIRGGTAYCAAKSGVEMLTKVSAAELGPRGIRVNCVAPGMVGSDGAQRSWRRAGLDVPAIESRIPLGRVGTPEEVARVIVFLGSAASSYITGEILRVDGGPQMEGPLT